MLALFVALHASAPTAGPTSPSGSSPVVPPPAGLSSPAIAGLTTFCVAVAVGAIFLAHRFCLKRARPKYFGLYDQNLTTGQLMG
jgi:hypothetical protein